MGLRDYLNKNIGAFDIEVMRWWTANPVVYANAIVSDIGDWIDCILPIDSQEVVSETGRKAQYQCFGEGLDGLDELRKNSTLMLARTAQRIRRLGVRITQNGFGYDYPVCNKTPGIFLIGSDNAGPQNLAFRRGIIDSHGRQASADAIDLDTTWMARAYLLAFLNDAKLETLAAFCDRFMGLQLGFAKLHTYQEQAELVEKALAGDREAATKLAKYNYEDAIVSYLIGKRFLPILFNIADACQVTYFDALNESPKNVALFYTDRVEMSALHRPRNRRVYTEFDDAAHMGAIVDRHVPWTVRKGSAKDVLVAYYPFANNLEAVLQQDPAKQKILELSRNAKNPVEAYMYNLVLEGWVGEILCDLERAQERPDFNAVLRGKYKGHDQKTIHNTLHENVKNSASKAFAGTTVLNRYRNIFFLQGISEEEAARRGFVPFGTADVISVDKGRVIHKLRGEILSSGIDIPSKKKRIEEPGKNAECALEVKVVRDFVEEYFENPARAFECVYDYARAFAEKKVPVEDLLMRVVKHEEPKNMSPEQQRTRRGRIIRSFDAEIGESIVYMLVPHPTSNDEFFVRYDPAEKGFGISFEPAWEAYRDEIFGVKEVIKELEDGTVRKEKKYSTLYEICKALLIGDDKSRKRRQALQSLLSGNGSLAELKDFIASAGNPK